MCKKGYDALLGPNGSLTYTKEANAYQQVVDDFYGELVQYVGVGEHGMEMLSVAGVHGISPTNLKIFDKLFAEDG